MATPVRDFALVYDPVNRRADYAFDGRDFAFDSTPASAMIFSLFADRRARPDDSLPAPVADWANPSSLVAKRGWCGDFLSRAGGLIGSRLWLLVRRKATPRTRADAAEYAAEALGWIETTRNLAVDVAADWVSNVGTPTLALRCRAGRTRLTVTRQVA